MQVRELVSESASSSTTSLHDYPAFLDDRDYHYERKKPKDNSGHIRAIANQNKRFKGVVAHNGKDSNPNRGPMHWVDKVMRKKLQAGAPAYFPLKCR